MKTIPPFAVSSSGWTSYTPSTVCKKIRVQETGQAGTTDYYVAAPTTSDGPLTKVAGQPYEVSAPGNTFFAPASGVVFYLKTATGSVNFDAEES